MDYLPDDFRSLRAKPKTGLWTLTYPPLKPTQQMRGSISP